MVNFRSKSFPSFPLFLKKGIIFISVNLRQKRAWPSLSYLRKPMGNEKGLKIMPFHSSDFHIMKAQKEGPPLPFFCSKIKFPPNAICQVFLPGYQNIAKGL